MEQSEIVTQKGMMMLPPAKGLCQECATEHRPEQPHNRASLYYQIYFYNKYNRYPTWADAMQHCTAEVKAVWEEGLKEIGEWE